jgi:hypothetical protein
MVWNEIQSVFLFCEMVRNGIPSILSSPEGFGTKLRSPECFSLLRNGSERNTKFLPQNGSEQNNEVPIVYIFYKMVLNFRGMARNGIPSFSVLRNRQNCDGINQNFHLFRPCFAE